ncbi:MAG TPA: hypothetical protein DIT25_01160 [Candidatus Moranbacteria bacterium]|nr:hypothetical protein [Candidatus Moranbacteria bacterium]
MENPYLSIVIPAYNEASRQGKGIREHMKEIKAYFEGKNISYEVVVVNDGSKDDTSEVVKSFMADFSDFNFIDRKENKGKLFSVQEGLLKAKGKFRLFTDADGATPIETLDNFWGHLEAGEHVIIGSRDLQQSKIEKHQPKVKELLGNMGNLLIQFTLDLRGIEDTQCGFKVLSQEVVEKIIPQMKAIRWGGDFEILALAKKMGYKIIEVPVTWIDSGQSTVGIKGYIQTLKELFQVKWRMVTGQYQCRNNKQ